MKVRRWLWLVVSAVVGVPLLLLGYDRVFGMHWVGGTDLEVEFAVADAITGRPVPGAAVEVQSAGGFYAEDYVQEFTLEADAGGSARKVCRNTMCAGTRSGLGMTDTFGTHLPHWRYRVTAAGYEPTDPIWITHGPGRAAERTGPGCSRLVVPVALTPTAEHAAAPPPADG